MTQVTNEMVEAAKEAWEAADWDGMQFDQLWRAALEAALAVRSTVSDAMVSDAMREARRYARDVMGVACEVDGPTMRVALEAALVVRKPIDADIGEIIGTLRSWAAALDIPSGPFANEDISAAADLIERQAEEIKRLTAQFDDGRTTELFIDTIRQITTERAELIEALRPFSEWSLELKGMDDDNLLLATYDKEREDNRFGTVGDCRRARALLERIGAKEVG